MLVPVRNIDAWVVTTSQPDVPANDPAVQTYIRGAQSIRDKVNFDGRLLHTSWSRQGQTELFKSLQVQAYPSVIFVDADTNTTITRLQGNFTAEKVASVMLQINQLSRDPSGKYFWPDGNIFAVEGKPGNSDFGLGLLNIKIPKWGWAMAAIVAGSKALSANNTGKYVYGGLSAYSLYKYKNAQ